MSNALEPLAVNIKPARPVVLFDGVCHLCNGMVQFLIHRDKHARLSLASMQSAPGQALLKHFGRPLGDYDTMVFVECGRAYTKSNAVLRITRFFPWPWPVVAVAMVIPTFLRDACYDLLAQNRYRLFGRQATCMMPTPDTARRFLN